MSLEQGQMPRFANPLMAVDIVAALQYIPHLVRGDDSTDVYCGLVLVCLQGFEQCSIKWLCFVDSVRW